MTDRRVFSRFLVTGCLNFLQFLENGVIFSEKAVERLVDRKLTDFVDLPDVGRRVVELFCDRDEIVLRFT